MSSVRIHFRAISHQACTLTLLIGGLNRYMETRKRRKFTSGFPFVWIMQWYVTCDMWSLPAAVAYLTLRPLRSMSPVMIHHAVTATPHAAWRL